MSDKEFILFLCKLFWNLVADGSEPSDEEWKTINQELRKRDIDPDEILVY